ncbi:sensor histidine kinase [Romboutsia lituseburensis]|uniref:histidine kinase n=1 Tax=Romboutsia lituseburensis DSM 797 TaxID=1121325 RepID=A0A1G9MXV2_9FIRM|nr:sensor histidine kinase [Romboutsia lituseburensis]SDL78953.1 Signal transduction histidine kinase [Romboutsia lituseburensis DSM 797]
MKLSKFLKDRGLFLSINLILALPIVLIMVAFKFKIELIAIIMFIWFVPLMSYILLEFNNKKKFYDELEDILANIDKKYLLSEIMKKPSNHEEEKIKDILTETNRSMREQINYYKNIQKEYQEYIETWVHEIKTPIASTMLIIENNEELVPYSMKNEIKKIENYIDQVLYYSRSNDVSKDYIIKKMDLEYVVRNVVKKNASDFINKKIAIDMHNLSGFVYSDSKWIEFIINQIISNSIKYSTTENPKVSIYSTKNENNTILTIKDNGVGISPKDLNRVFEKGFTGENGRLYGKSTGIGLYLCKKLCDKLGIGLTLNSIHNKGTEINIIFPIGRELK